MALYYSHEWGTWFVAQPSSSQHSHCPCHWRLRLALITSLNSPPTSLPPNGVPLLWPPWSPCPILLTHQTSCTHYPHLWKMFLQGALAFFRETLPGDLPKISISQQPPFPHTHIPPDRPHSPFPLRLCSLWQLPLVHILFDYLFGVCLPHWITISLRVRFLSLFSLMCLTHSRGSTSICWINKLNE